MKTRMLILLCALVAAPWSFAFSVEKAEASQDESVTAFQKVADEHAAKVKEYREKTRGVRDREKFMKLRAEYYPKPGDFVPKMMKVVEAHPKSQGALEALNWVLGNDRQNGATTVLPIIERDFIEHDSLADLCRRLGRNSTNDARTFLEKVVAKNKHYNVLGAASFSLAQWHMNGSRNLGYLNSNDKKRADSVAKRMGAAAVTYVKAAGQEQLMQIALKHFQRVESEFPNAPYYGDRKLGPAATAAVFEAKNLQIGCAAPEITAEDIDGVEFSLSDYRGKVVVLDFWGDW